VGEIGKRKRSEVDEEGAIDLPFAVEVGSAVRTSDGFAVSALKDRTALVALVAEDAGQGRLVELEEVHGDVEPPKLASYANKLIAVVVGNDATSSTLSLAAVHHTGGEAAVTHGRQVRQGRDASNAFDLAVGGSGGLLVWDRWDRASGHGRIEHLVFDPVTLDEKRPPGTVDLGDDDAETPRILARAGGFWLVWVSHGAPERPSSVARPGAPPHGAASAVGSASTEELTSVIDVTPRRLKVVALDGAGVPVGKPLTVTAPDAHVLTYDVVSFRDGLLMAWRDDPTALGVEAPSLHWARVNPDGSVLSEVIEDARLRVGTPRLFLDRVGKPKPAAWLAAVGAAGRPLFGYFDADGGLVTPLQEVTGLGVGEPLALHASRFLLAQPKGRALDLQVASCELVQELLRSGGAR
jgi:hypothetical protein